MANMKSPINVLQEYAQSRQWQLPSYNSIVIQDGKYQTSVSLITNDGQKYEAFGFSICKQDSRHDAAKHLLQQLNDQTGKTKYLQDDDYFGRNFVSSNACDVHCEELMRRITQIEKRLDALEDQSLNDEKIVKRVEILKDNQRYSQPLRSANPEYAMPSVDDIVLKSLQKGPKTAKQIFQDTRDCARILNINTVQPYNQALTRLLREKKVAFTQESFGMPKVWHLINQLNPCLKDFFPDQ